MNEVLTVGQEEATSESAARPAGTPRAGSSRSGEAAQATPAPLEVRILPDERARPRLFLVQLPLRTDHLEPVSEPTTIGRLEGSALAVAEETIARILRPEEGSGRRRPLLTPEADGGSTPVALDEIGGIRLALLLSTAGTVRSPEKISRLGQEIADLDEYDLIYWIRKFTGKDRERWVKRFVQTAGAA